MGIGKRELLRDYYPDELAAVFGEYGLLHRLPAEEEVEMTPLEFLGPGGERIA